VEGCANVREVNTQNNNTLSYVLIFCMFLTDLALFCFVKFIQPFAKGGIVP